MGGCADDRSPGTGAAGPSCGRGKIRLASRGRGELGKGLPGEGKERWLLEEIDIARPGPTTAPASPRGEARGRAPENGGYAKVSEEREQERPHLQERRTFCKGFEVGGGSFAAGPGQVARQARRPWRWVGWGSWRRSRLAGLAGARGGRRDSRGSGGTGRGPRAEGTPRMKREMVDQVYTV